MIETSALADELLWLVVATGLMLPVVVLPAVQELRKPGVATPWMLLGAWGATALPTLLGGLLLWGWADKDAEGLRLAATSFAALRLGACLTAAPVLLSAAGAGLFFTLRSEEPRHRGRAVAVAVAGLAVAALVAAGGVMADDLLFSSVRAVAYGLLAVPVAVLATGPRPALVSLFPLAVALGEAGHRGMVGMLVVLQTRSVPRELWTHGVVRFYEAVAVQQQVGWAAVVLACGVALLGAWWGRARASSVAGAVASVGLALAVIGGADIGLQRADDLQRLCPVELPTP
jgi:hypothetical protein